MKIFIVMGLLSCAVLHYTPSICMNVDLWIEVQQKTFARWAEKEKQVFHKSDSELLPYRLATLCNRILILQLDTKLLKIPTMEESIVQSQNTRHVIQNLVTIVGNIFKQQKEQYSLQRILQDQLAEQKEQKLPDRKEQMYQRKKHRKHEQERLKRQQCTTFQKNKKLPKAQRRMQIAHR